MKLCTMSDIEKSYYWGQRCKLGGKLGRSCPVGLGTSIRILRGNPAIFGLSRNFAIIFWIFLPDFQHFWFDFGHFWADFELFLTTFISGFSVNRSDSEYA